MKVQIQTATPEFLYWAPSATGPAPVVAVNATTNAPVGPPDLIPGFTRDPAKPGDILTVYCVGFGPTTPGTTPGGAPTGAAQTVATPSVTLGTVTLDPSLVLYAGVTPGFAGLYQLNIAIPPDTQDGTYSLQLSLGAFKTPPGSLVVAH